jgi:hypothetical protein
MTCEATVRVEKEVRTKRRASFIVKWMDSVSELLDPSAFILQPVATATVKANVFNFRLRTWT